MPRRSESFRSADPLADRRRGCLRCARTYCRWRVSTAAGSVNRSTADSRSRGNLIGDPQVVLSADRKIGLDGIHLRYAREHGGWRDEVADLDLRDAGNSTDERAYFRETQIQGGLLHRGAPSGHGRLRGQLRLGVALELTARDGIRLGFRDVAIDVESGIAELCFC